MLLLLVQVLAEDDCEMIRSLFGTGGSVAVPTEALLASGSVLQPVLRSAGGFQPPPPVPVSIVSSPRRLATCSGVRSLPSAISVTEKIVKTNIYDIEIKKSP
jgi:hypothetical protein